MKFTFITGVIGFACCMVWAQDTISFSGQVKNNHGQAIADAKVSVSGTTLSVQSGANGEFSFNGAMPVVSDKLAGSTILLLYGEAKTIVFSTNQRDLKRITLYNIRGQKIAEKTSHGSFVRLPFTAASGFYLGIVHSGLQQFRFSMICLEGEAVLFSKIGSWPETIGKAGNKTAKTLATATTIFYLNAEKSGYLTGTKSVVGPNASNILITMISSDSFAQGPAYKNPALPIEQRVADLVSRMTESELLAQATQHTPEIPRLGVSAYSYQSEALHGIALQGHFTVFPQAIGFGATWDPELLLQITTSISDEARASNPNNRLTFWAPNINIFRDPRWGQIGRAHV
jgi:hypothetical protein